MKTVTLNIRQLSTETNDGYELMFTSDYTIKGGKNVKSRFSYSNFHKCLVEAVAGIVNLGMEVGIVYSHLD